ncbi:hypothetical protein CHLRE_09g413132v5 [Chlamydomonas reinhardtii]|uniref:Uncharacterized protein n=1 Tax=Chlamydomonas reinhardtii TaxID=3055 RepID=A0A2K3DFT3_CHLRE|nr:uncharacterized protein CHLRE_09g413132v5 [Chlamydomonas reinhardtii]PNW79388.1 hypothetical protein CHLRE_09g413132v5 [Chlamydomonas reinhardtii]
MNCAVQSAARTSNGHDVRKLPAATAAAPNTGLSPGLPLQRALVQSLFAHRGPASDEDL